MKTAELTGVALDWAVAVAEGGTDFGTDGITYGFKLHGRLKVLATGWALTMSYHPSTDWKQGGPIIEREKICTDFLLNGQWLAISRTTEKQGYGPTPLIAAMRCYVASKLGDNTEIPEELTQ